MLMTHSYVSRSSDENPISKLVKFIDDIKSWLKNFLQLDNNRTGILVVVPQKQRRIVNLNVNILSLKHSEQVKDL